ncbi:MAG: hypothetical protein JOY66_17985 [Acetobacteraceae bacterium]|nr:hypothetical protein [Acetobacteraceae bacterium]
MSDRGNGADLGSVIAMLSGVLEGQQSVQAEIRSMRTDIQEIKGVVNQHTLTLAEHGRRLNDLTGQVNSLREAVTAYHASVLGHGILISELDARVRRIEHHLNLPPAA